MKRMWSKNELNKIIATLVASGSLPSIKADEIIENMEGYSYDKASEISDLTREFIYAGAVKNGNKLTLVIAVNLTRADTLTGDVNLGNFTIPEDVASKIIPSTIGNYDYVSVDNPSAWKNDATSQALQVWSQKYDNTIIFKANRDSVNLLDANDKYYLRFEVTLLLSESLISE